MAEYHSLTDLLQMIDNPHQDLCLKLWEDHRDLFSAARGGKSNHQTWVGGYLDHVTEVMNIAVVLYSALHPQRSLPFSLSDALLVLYLHDIDKPWRYEQTGNAVANRAEMSTKEQREQFSARKIKEYEFPLTEEHSNALKYVEGEITDYSPHQRKQGPLAAFCHLCDVTSARIWFDHPLEEGDSWTGAKRRKL